MKFKQLTFTFLTFCIAIVVGTANATSMTVIASSLDNVRGLNFGPDGALYVTEAGSGGTGACIPSPSVQGAFLCYGSTGAVTRILGDRQERVLTGLPSIALPNGTEAAGPQDIAFDLTGNAYLLVGYAGNPDLRDTVLHAPDMGQLLRIDLNTNSWTRIADLASYESFHNPAQDDTTSNPFALQIRDNTVYIIDAGANDLLSVGTDGSNVTLKAAFFARTFTNPIFPPSDQLPPREIALQSVPTGIAVGPDDTYYVSEFTGFPYPQGKARISRVEADGHQIVYANGFTQLVDLAFDAQGNLYVLEHAIRSLWKNKPAGSLIKISPEGTCENIVTGRSLFFPTALTLGPDGAIYVSNQGSLPGQGQVLRIDPAKDRVPRHSRQADVCNYVEVWARQ